VVEDAAAVLRADVGPLAVGGRRVVHAVEVLEQAAVGDLGRVEDDLEGFGVCVLEERKGVSARDVLFEAHIDRSACARLCVEGFQFDSRPVLPEHTAR
jgi:hypothetical protein